MGETPFVISVFLGMKMVIPEMLKIGGGSIINISFVYGLVGGSTSAAYTASKGEIITLTKNAAVDFGKHNIRVNSVLPAQIETPMMEKLITFIYYSLSQVFHGSKL